MNNTYEQLLNKLIGLPGLRIIDCDQFDRNIVLNAVLKEEYIVCPYCKTKHLSKNGTYERILTDTPLNGCETTIVISGHKYNCLNPKCGKRNVVPRLPEVFDEKAHITIKLKNEIANRDFSKDTFENIANNYFVSVDTVRKIFKEKIDTIDSKLLYPAPVVLGVDEVHIQNYMRFVMVDLEHSPVSLIEIASKRDKQTVIKYLSRFDQPDRIKFVMMDMYNAYKEAVHTVLPDAKIVIDKFHIIRYLNDATEKSRKLACQYIEDKISTLPEEEKEVVLNKWHKYNSGSEKMNHYWFKKNRENLSDLQRRRIMSLIKDFPEFGEILRIKELFLDIYKSKTREEAEMKFDNWKNSPGIKDSTSFVYPFYEIVGMITRWRIYFFNYFDVPEGLRRTNGGTEGINSEIKRVNNNGKGYSFEILRGKLLYGNNRVKLLTGAEKKAKNESFDSFFKNFAGMDTLYDFNTLTDCTSMFIEACSNNPDIYQYADVLADAYLGNTMRLSEFMMGQSDLYNALKAAADTLDNTKASSKYYLRIPVSKKELREIITINNFNIAHNLETLELEEYEKEPIEN